MLIEIKNLTLQAIIGIYELERLNTQNLTIECKIFYDNKHKSLQNGYLDYDKLVECLKNMIISQKFGLLEEALECILAHFLDTYKAIYKMTLTITKNDIFKDCNISVTHTLHRKKPHKPRIYI